MKASIALTVVAAACLSVGALAQNEQKSGVTPKSFKLQDQLKANEEAKKAQEATRKAIENDPAMKKWVEYSTPGEPQKRMEALVGQWDGEVTMWMAPGAPEQTSTTKATIKMELGGRYLRATHEGVFMGLPFNGTSVWGYNNLRKEYESTWIDNMGTGIMYSTGQCDSTGKVFTFTGEADDFDTGKKVKERSVTTVAGADSWKMEMFRPGPDGKEYKTMEINYHRLGTAAGGGLKRSGQAPAAGKKDPVKDTDKPATPQPTAPK